MTISSEATISPRLARRVVAGYATGSIGTGVFSTVPTVLLLYFCTEILCLPPGWAAVAVFLPKVWSILWDPFVGAWSDRTRSRFGRRRPFMVVGSAGVGFCFAALFAPPSELSTTLTFAWVAISYFAMATAYSMFAVPYIALPAELAEGERFRGNMVSARMIVAMLGVLLGAGIAPLIVASFGGGRSGYAAMGVIIAASCALAMIPPIQILRKSAPPQLMVREPIALVAALRRAVRIRPFAGLASAYLLQITATGAVSAAAPYLVTRVWNRGEGDVGLALGSMILVTAMSIPLWSSLGRRFGERPMLAAAALTYAATAAGLGLAAELGADWPWVLLAFGSVGIPFAGLQVLPFTLLADIAHATRKSAGVTSEGTMTGVWTAGEKLGLGLGPAAVGIALSFAGGKAEGLALFMLIIPAGLMLLSLPLVLRRERIVLS